MPLPDAIAPPIDVALARVVAQLPNAEALPGGAMYEPKWDGYRLVIFRGDDTVTLWSRQGKNLTQAFPDLADAALEQLPDGCVVDGEAVVWENGRLNFDALQGRLGARAFNRARMVRERPASFAAFDVLAVADRDIRHVPLEGRRMLLEELALGWEPPLNLSPVTRDVDEARRWLDELSASGIEGLVVKGAGQRYEGGRREWLKVKHRDVLDVVAGAVLGPIDRPEQVVVGLPVDGELRIVGRSSPLNSTVARSLAAHLRPPVGEHPWPAEVKPGALDRFNNRGSSDPVQLTLVDPIVVEISADVAWSGRSFRHAVRYLRARPELDPAEVPPRSAGS